MKPKHRLKLLTLLLILISGLTFTLLSCSSPTNPDLLPSLTITVDGVTSTEAFIKLSTNNVTLPANVVLSRNSKQINSFTLITVDTTIVDENLIPNQSYTYQATIQSSNQTDIQSESVTVTTMDTTSHNFSWQTYTFGGQGGSSTLYDVAIINENDIWAVGEMYVYDSTGTPVLYNAVHWDGSKWELKRIKYFGQCSAVVYPSLRAIIAFSKKDIVVTNGGSIGFFDGTKIVLDCGVNPLLNGAIKKIWGTSSKDFYVVGNKGTIAHYKNGFWGKINSGTTTNINDMWGTQNDNTNNLILSAVSNVASSGDRRILKLNNNIVSDFLWDTGRRVQSIWFKNKNVVYTSGGGVFRLKDGNHWEEIKEIPLYYTEEIRGNDINDIMVVGDFGLLAHYNGISWKIFNNPKSDIYYSCAIDKNLVVAVGTRGSKGFIALAHK